MSTYSNNYFSVEVSSDGAIQVQSGDYISKYSAAIHNDFIHIYEYGRKNGNGTIQPISDTNKIFAGETIYYLPVSGPAPDTATPRLSDDEKKKIILNALKAEFNLRGEHLKVLSDVIEIAGYTDNVVALAEIAGLISEGSIFGAAASTLSVAVIFAGPIAGILTLINANEFGERNYGMRAIAYAITAWSYNEAILPGSNRIIQNLRNGFPRVTHEELKRYHAAWKQASKSMLLHLNHFTNTKKISKESLQLLLKALGKNNKRQLCLELLKGFEPEFDKSELRFWRATYNILYPE